MSNNLNLTQMVDGQATPEVTVNDTNAELDAALTEYFDTDLVAGNTVLTSSEFQRAMVIRAINNAVATRTVTIPAVKKLFVFENLGTATVSIILGSTTLILGISQSAIYYCDGTANGLIEVTSPISGSQDYKDSCLLATTGNVALTGEQTIDGTLTSADDVLVWQQSTASENGIYTTDAGAWIRRADFDEDAEVTSGVMIPVTDGVLYGDKLFMLATSDPIVVDTTNLTLVSIAGIGAMFNVVEDTTPQLGGPLDSNAKSINESEGAIVASATDTDIWSAEDGNTLHISGTTQIDDFSTPVRIGAWRKLIFDGILILSDNANITNQTGASITTAVGDIAFVYATTLTTFTTLYFKADGQAIAFDPASPPAIGATAPAAGSFTAVTSDTRTTGAGTKTEGLVESDSNELQTTDATVTTLFTHTLADENTYQIEVDILGVQSDGSNRGTFKVMGTFYRTAAGIAVQQGTTTTVHSATSFGSGGITFVISTNDVLVSVQGILATTIEWGGISKIINMSN
jgi:uncharacterized cupin superfamily protein